MLTLFKRGQSDVSTVEITNNITLITRGGCAKKQDKPLVILLPWLMAKRSHVSKFTNFYLQQDFEVINVEVSPWQILWPLRGTQVVAGDIIRFLDGNNLRSPLLLHGFSVGGYVWSEVLVRLEAERGRYRHILDRFVGQVWDSLADITEIPEGFPYAVFPTQQLLREALRRYVLYHLAAFDKVATCHYVRGSQMFYTNTIRAPALMFVSKSDPIGSERANLRLAECWREMDIKVYWKCWDDSPHVGHFRKYRREYVEVLETFLKEIGLSKCQKRLEAKL